MLYFISHPIQYFSPLFKILSSKIELDVVYFSDVSIKGGKDVGFGQTIKWDTPLLDGYSFYFVNNWFKGKPINNRFWDVFNPGVIKLLLKSEHKIVVVNGWSYSSNWLVFIFGKLLGKEIWLRAESPLNQELRKGKMILFVKSILLQHILFKFFIDKFLYIGTQNKAFYQYYGVYEESRFIHTPYAVDNDFFKNQAKDLKPFKLNLLQELSIPLEKKIILFSGKYSFFIYLFHQLINGLLFAYIFNSNPVLNTTNNYLVEILAVLLTMFLAVISFKFYESKFIAIGQSLTYD